MSLLRDAQKRLAKALLKQRLKAQGVPVPPEAELDRQTERLLDEANRVLKSHRKAPPRGVATQSCCLFPTPHLTPPPGNCRHPFRRANRQKDCPRALTRVKCVILDLCFSLSGRFGEDCKGRTGS